MKEPCYINDIIIQSKNKKIFIMFKFDFTIPLHCKIWIITISKRIRSLS